MMTTVSLIPLLAVSFGLIEDIYEANYQAELTDKLRLFVRNSWLSRRFKVK